MVQTAQHHVFLLLVVEMGVILDVILLVVQTVAIRVNLLALVLGVLVLALLLYA